MISGLYASKRYVFRQDQSCHWYIVPVDKLDVWRAWSDLSEDDPGSWDAPDFAFMLGGGYHDISFENPAEI